MVFLVKLQSLEFILKGGRDGEALKDDHNDILKIVVS